MSTIWPAALVCTRSLANAGRVAMNVPLLVGQRDLLKPDAPVRDNHLPLFKRMVQPDPRLHSLWFMGLAQSLPTLVNLAEQQSKLLAAWLAGDSALPSPNEMRATLAADEKLHRGHYYASSRHTMQVDFDVYVRDLLKEVKAGSARKLKKAA